MFKNITIISQLLLIIARLYALLSRFRVVKTFYNAYNMRISFIMEQTSMTSYHDDDTNSVDDFMASLADHLPKLSTENGGNVQYITDSMDDFIRASCFKREIEQTFCLFPTFSLPVRNVHEIQLIRSISWIDIIQLIMSHSDANNITTPIFTTQMTGDSHRKRMHMFFQKEDQIIGFVTISLDQTDKYSKLICNINATTLSNIQNIVDFFDHKYQQCVDYSHYVNIRWFVKKGSYDIMDDFGQKLLDECYPQLNQSVDEFVQSYINAKESVIILKGPPGTGKTSLCRYICNKLISGRNEHICYTSDSQMLETDEMFVEFVTNESAKALVLEDIDLHLTSRSDGNTFMYKLLGASDGFVRNVHKKIIISTNVTRMAEIDSALLRPGRCWKFLDIRPLTKIEAVSVLIKMGKDPDLLPNNQNSFTVAELYAM